MVKKILPIAAVALTFFAACSDDESSASIKVSQESTDEGELPQVFSEERKFDAKCDSDNEKNPVDSMAFESVYNVQEKKGSVKVFVLYESNDENEKAVELCEKFAKKFGFEDYDCAEGVETDSLHSTIKKETSVAEDNFDGYVEFLCGGGEE